MSGGPLASRMRDALLKQSPLSVASLALATGSTRGTIRAYLFALRQAGLVEIADMEAVWPASRGPQRVVRGRWRVVSGRESAQAWTFGSRRLRAQGKRSD